MPMAHDYVVQVEPIPPFKGGGWIGRVPNLPECMSDGDDLESLKVSIADAIETWISAVHRLGRPVPRPVDWQQRRA